MKLRRRKTVVVLRLLLFASVVCSVLVFSLEVAGARPQRRSAPRARRSHAVGREKPPDTVGNEFESQALNSKPRLKLADGTSIPVDDAWENSQGIWYQKDGVTYLVERTKVRAIERGSLRETAAQPGSEAKAVPVIAANTDANVNPVWIHLVGGARVEADEATESTAGVWFRRGSLSVFIERSRVERIEREEIADAAGPRSKAGRGWSTGSSKLDGLIKQNGARYGVDPYLIFLVMEEESHFNSRVVSPKGARGLMQLMPGTSARFGVRHPFSPAENVSAGVRYLKQLLRSHNGRVDLTLASYNAGEGAVAKWGHRVPPYRETRNYVRRISARYRKNEIAESARRAASPTGTN